MCCKSIQKSVLFPQIIKEKKHLKAYTDVHIINKKLVRFFIQGRSCL